MNKLAMNKRLAKILMAGASPVFVLMTAGPVFAQSTGTQAVESIESVTITAEQQISGIMKPITVPKERSTITQDFINTQPAGQSIFDTLNKVPGFNFTNNDPYGNSGGDVRIHGFDGNHISFTWDGMPLNDTGNYAIYTNQVADEEVIGSASVNQGTTDVDSPTAAATGGVVSIVTSRPKDDYGALSDSSLGSYNYRREFLRVDTGAFGPWGTTAFVSGSYTYYNKFKGPGYEQKQQFNAALYQDLGDRGWIQLAMHWNSNRNNFYNNPSYYPVVSTVQNGIGVTPFPLVAATPTTSASPGAPNLALSPTGNFTGTGPTNAATGFGLQYDEQPTCTRLTSFTTGKADNDASCSSFYGVRINPSDTGNLRLSSLIHLTDDLSLTFDPSLQYVLANGGGYTSLSETDPRLLGNTKAVGVDLTRDGDVLDTVGVYSPSNTNTIRYGLNTSLVWRITQDHTVQFAYTGDFGFHRQTGQMSFLGPQGYPFDPFGGYRDVNDRVLSADGVPIRSRDRRSHAFLNQVAFAYQGNFWDDKFQLAAGVRSPFLTRDLNQLCYEQVTGSSAGFPTCTSGLPTSVNAANNTVTLPGSTTNLFVTPAKETVNFNRVLPNAGFVLAPFGPQHQLYADYAASLAAPRTDNLYNGGNNGLCVVNGASTPTNPGCVYSSFSKVNPETSVNYDIGYRFTSDMVTASITGYNTQFKNRIVTSFDQEQGISIDRNIGSVNVDGVDAEANVQLMPELSVYTSVAYTHSRVSAGPLAIIQVGAGGQPINLAGKTLVETPDYTVSQRYEYKIFGFNIGAGFKYVGSRFATDNNDYKAPSYTLVDADVTYDLGEIGWKDSYLKFNASNLFNARYLGSISSKPCFIPTLPSSSACGSYPTFVIGSPQVFQVTLRSVL